MHFDTLYMEYSVHLAILIMANNGMSSDTQHNNAPNLINNYTLNGSLWNVANATSYLEEESYCFSTLVVGVGLVMGWGCMVWPPTPILMSSILCFS